MNMNVSEKFFFEIDHVAGMTVPATVMERAKHSLLDYLAVTCAGAVFQSEKLKRYFDFAQPEAGMFKAIGLGRNLVLKEAVFLNGLNAHALDFDDGTNSGIIHLGSPIFSLLLPLAQRYHIQLDKLLSSAIVGYEASYTMAVSIQPKHKAMGYHATGTCGVIGATLAAAYMLDFSAEERYQAFATSCVSATGMLKVLDDGSELKPYNVAKTVLLALSSLQLAKAGFKGHTDPLGGYRGFLKMMSGDDKTEIKSALLNGSYAIMKSYTKPYASCRYTHPAVEAAILLRNENMLSPGEIKSIEVETYDLAVSGHDHKDVIGSYSAKMSIPYSTAVALIYGKAGLQEFGDDALNSDVVKELTNKVNVVADEKLSVNFPMEQSAIVTIRSTKGDFTKKIDYPKGEPENPMSEDEFYNRYKDLMTFGNVKEDVYTSIYKMMSQKNTKVTNLIINL